MIFNLTNQNLSQGGKEIIDAKLNDFDSLYKKCWEDLYEKGGVFRYKVNISKEKILNGKYGFLLQLNSDRNTNRRSPAEMKSTIEEFDPNKFNFTKISSEEKLFEIQNNDDSQNRHIIIINVSPICFGHGLLCPSVDKCLPQIITYESFKLVIQLMFASCDRNLRIGFNSLCGLASVNHLHYHLLIVKHRFLLETIECKHITGNLFILKDNYPAPAFCFQIQTESDINTVSAEVNKLIELLIKRNVAHNLFITKGKDLSVGNKEALRIFVWVRRSCFGAKPLKAFCVAVCELSGHLPIYNGKEFDLLTEDDVVQELKKWTTETFQDVYDEVVTLF